MTWTPDQPQDPYDQLQDPYRSPLSQDTQPPAWPAPVIKHSGLGIASLILAIVSGLSIFAVLILAGVLQASTPGIMDEESPVVMMIGFAVIGSAGLGLIGLGLGIAGLLQSNRQKVAPVLGLILNGLVVLGFCGIMAVGLAAQGM